MATREKIYRLDGRVCVHTIGGFDGVVFLDAYADSVTSMFGFFAGKRISVRVWFSDKPMPWNELDERFLVETLYGQAKPQEEHYHVVYSEYTEDDFYVSDLKIGGHDLNRILMSHIGRYAYIEISAVSVPFRVEKMFNG